MGPSRRAASAVLALLGLLCPATLWAKSPDGSGAAGAAPAPPAPLRPRHVLRPSAGFFDDAIALDAEGRRVAMVRTDGATFTALDIVDASSGNLITSWELGADRSVESLQFLPEGQGMLVILRAPEPESPAAGLVAIQLDAGGKVTGTAGPATGFATSGLNEGAKKTIVLGMNQKIAMRDGLPGEVTYTLSAFSAGGLAPIGKPRTYVASAEGELKGLRFKLIGFFDGYTRMLGERAGSYDRRQDFRRPSRRVVFDTLRGRVLEEGEIEDVYAWALAAQLRARGPNRTIFVQPNADQTGLDLITAAGARVPAATAVPFRLYDRASLVDQEQDGDGDSEVDGGGLHYFSLAIDPVNPDAVARRKADLPLLDLYAASVRGAGCTLRARVRLPRPVSWRAGHGRLAVLKRFKSFTRGGDELELYDLR